MIQLITGTKGTGKTKAIIDRANDHVETAKGDIIFLTDTDRYMYSLRYQIRTINVSDLHRGTETYVREDMLVGFIYGVLAGNHDIETAYLDGAHRLLGKHISEMEHFFRWSDEQMQGYVWDYSAYGNPGMTPAEMHPDDVEKNNE